MRRERGAVYDDFIRWGSNAHVELSTNDVLVSFAQPNQLIKARLDYPQTWSVLLVANLLTAIKTGITVGLDWSVTVGTGNSQSTLKYQFIFDTGAATPVEHYNSLRSASPQIFKELEFPARDIQLVCQMSITTLAGDTRQELDVASYAAPRVLHGYGVDR
jgi:hypothetical protein